MTKSHPIAVIFEVSIKATRKEQYLDIAQTLKSDLEKVDGFISIERFQSLADDEKLLSLSFWRDAAAVKAWREHTAHQDAQQLGKTEIFNNYHIRIAEVVRSYGMHDQ